MLGLRLNWLVPLGFISYLFYTLFFVCLINDLSKDVIPDSCGLNYYTCLTANVYIKPYYIKSIDPFIQDNVTPFIESKIKIPLDRVDAKFGMKDKLSLGIKHIKETDEKFRISDRARATLLNAQSKIEAKTIPLRERVAQKSLEFQELTNTKILPQFDTYLVFLKSKFDLAQIKAKIYGFNIKEFITYLGVRIREVYYLLLKKSNSEYLQEKTNFIKEDFMRLIKFNEFKSISYEKTQSLLQVVRDVLEEVSDDVSDAVSDEISEKAQESEVFESDESDYSDDEPITIKITSTILVTATSSPSDLSTLTAEEIRLDKELYTWEQKVNRTLQLAENNLSTEMIPIIDSIVEQIKPIITEKFQDFQSVNYKTYRELNSLIAGVNKDYEEILRTNETVETVSRQDVRDSIAYSYKFSEDIVAEVREIIAEKHSIVLTEYFRVIQDTIDILESFAETTILEFSNKLSELINELENSSSDFDEKLSWNSWKRFHKIKEEIFNFRDTIYNRANDFKSEKSHLVPNGLQKWCEYMRNIDFHSSYLLRDNDDYLKLARAKANIAFQLREGITRTLEKIKEDNLKKMTEKEDIYHPEETTLSNETVTSQNMEVDENTIEVQNLENVTLLGTDQVTNMSDDELNDESDVNEDIQEDS